MSATATPCTHETVIVHRVFRRERARRYDEQPTRAELQHGLLDDTLGRVHDVLPEFGESAAEPSGEQLADHFLARVRAAGHPLWHRVGRHRYRRYLTDLRR